MSDTALRRLERSTSAFPVVFRLQHDLRVRCGPCRPVSVEVNGCPHDRLVGVPTGGGATTGLGACRVGLRGYERYERSPRELRKLKRPGFRRASINPEALQGVCCTTRVHRHVASSSSIRCRRSNSRCLWWKLGCPFQDRTGYHREPSPRSSDSDRPCHHREPSSGSSYPDRSLTCAQNGR